MNPLTVSHKQEAATEPPFIPNDADKHTMKLIELVLDKRLKPIEDSLERMESVRESRYMTAAEIQKEFYQNRKVNTVSKMIHRWYEKATPVNRLLLFKKDGKILRVLKSHLDGTLRVRK